MSQNALLSCCRAVERLVRRAAAPGTVGIAALLAVLLASVATGARPASADPGAAARGAETNPRRPVAVLEYRGGSAELPNISQRITALARARTSLAVMDVDDARRRFGARLDRQVAACKGRAPCIAQIGRTIGAAEVVLVGISQLGDVILTLQRVDVATGQVLGRMAETMEPGSVPADDALLGYMHRILPGSDFARFGVIRIDAAVAGATVIIDGSARGQTPLQPVRLPAPASYDIRVTKPGYLPFQISVAVPPDAQVDVRPQLQRQPETAWYRRWWVMAAAGALAAGTVAAIVVAQSDADDVPVTIGPFPAPGS